VPPCITENTIMTIELKQCKSLLLDSYGYNAADKILAVRFSKGGKLYHYADVPESVYDELTKAESVGVIFTKLVRGQYAYDIIPEPLAVAEFEE
jgi:hypothetical protein